MSGHRNFKELQKELEQRPDYAEKAAAARERHALEDATYEQTLAQLRRALDLTQTQLAETLELTQSEVSRIERRPDLFLSTLRRYLEAMGGDLELVGVFNDRRVTITLGELAEARAEAASLGGPLVYEVADGAAGAALGTTLGEVVGRVVDD